jgi:hypothetical protein
MTTETIARDVAEDVRDACVTSGRPTALADAERALAGLDPRELDLVRRVARSTRADKPLGPDAIVDVARGTAVEVAAARELAGYYAVKAERDALAMLSGKGAPPPARVGDEAPPPPDALAGEKVRLRKPTPPHEKSAESDAMLTLFAYHRDAVLVAQAMGVGLAELNDRVEALGLRRRINRLLDTTTDIDVFSPERLKAAKSSAQPAPVVRKKGGRPASVEAPAPAEPQPRAEPAANTEPVNAHGTRVYRRVEPRVEPAPASGARREYVREGKRRAKPAPKPVPAEKPAPALPAKAPFSELQGPGGRPILERLVADEKANPRVLAAVLAERFDGPGRPVSESDLRQLLAFHGLGPTFHEREVANARFLVGFHQGARAKLCNALQLSAHELGAYLDRLGVSEELERTRAERARVELGKKRLPDRIAQVLTRAPYLDDLGVLAVIDREVRAQLEQALATHGGGETAREALAVDPKAFTKLLKRYGLEPAPA